MDQNLYRNQAYRYCFATEDDGLKLLLLLLNPELALLLPKLRFCD